MSNVMRVRTLLVTAIAAIALLLGAAPMSASAASNASVTLHVRLCPAGEPTANIFADCHAHPIFAGTMYKLNGHGSKTVDSSGNIAYSGLGAGVRTVTQTGGQEPNEFLVVRAFCSSDGGRAVEETVVKSPQSHFSFNLQSGAHVTCDVYFIRESGRS